MYMLYIHGRMLMCVLSLVQEKVYAKVVLYTSSLLLIGGAYFVK